MGSTFRQLPPLQPGEMLVESFRAPQVQQAAFLQTAAALRGTAARLPMGGMMNSPQLNVQVEAGAHPQSQKWVAQMPYIMAGDGH